MSKSFIFFDEEIMKGAERTLRNASENIKNEINTINRSLSSISRINECKLINNEFSSVLTSLRDCPTKLTRISNDMRNAAVSFRNADHIKHLAGSDMVINNSNLDAAITNTKTKSLLDELMDSSKDFYSWIKEKYCYLKETSKEFKFALKSIKTVSLLGKAADIYHILKGDMNKVGSVNILKSGLKKGIGFFGFSEEVADKSSQVTYTILSGLAIAPALKGDIIDSYKKIENDIKEKFENLKELFNIGELKNLKVNSIMTS